MDIFDEPDAEWIKTRKTFGSYYLLNRDLLYITDWPICFNIDMIEAVPALHRTNSETGEDEVVYPSTLYKEGNWTWDNFRTYLENIQTYYRGKKSPSGNDIVPFNTSYSYTILQALHSNGACMYDGENMEFDTPEAIEAAEYLADLMDKGLVSCSSASYGKSANNGYLNAVNAFMDGETVFTNLARWRMGTASTRLAERGESMGIIFFPRPDDIPNAEYGTTDYEIAISCADSVGLVRGFDEAESRLALEAYKLYKIEFYKNLGRVDSIEEYRETMAASEALQFGIDIFHPEIGDDNLEIFKFLGSQKENEFGEAMNLLWAYTVNIFGESVYGIGGSPKYAIAVQSEKSSIENSMNTIGTALKKTEATDDVTPTISQVESGPIVFEKGTHPLDIDWTEIFAASDNVDGTYEMNQVGDVIYIRSALDEDDPDAVEDYFKPNRVKIDCRETDFNTVGTYENGVTVEVTDNYGNTASKSYTIYIYDANNTVPPTLILKDEYDDMKMADCQDTSTIDWASHFVETAEDVNGIDLSEYVSADVREFDVTRVGTYDVTIYVEDFAGNRSEKTIPITIVK